MRIFYSDEGPIDTLLQIHAGPVWDGDLVSKQARDSFVAAGWVARCEGYNIITMTGRDLIKRLCLCRTVGDLTQGVGEMAGGTLQSQFVRN